jgi:hypothetical protein
LLPATATDVPTAPILTEGTKVWGVTENMVEAITEPDATSTAYPPDATSGTTRLAEIPPAPSEVTGIVAPEQEVE